jgi:AcrR family transcriptional regulator
MQTRLTRPEQAERIRSELLAAAREEFLRAGYHGATLDRIAAEAGYTKGVVYSRFAGKADLFLALLEERIESRAAQNAAWADSLIGIHGLDELVQRWADVERDDAAWSLLVIEFRVHASRDPELNERYAALHARTIAGVQEIFERVLGESSADFARMVLAVGLGTTLERAAAPDAVSSDDVRRFVTALAERRGLIT